MPECSVGRIKRHGVGRVEPARSAAAAITEHDAGQDEDLALISGVVQPNAP
jgi:hypothetical protein